MPTLTHTHTHASAHTHTHTRNGSQLPKSRNLLPLEDCKPLSDEFMRAHIQHV